MGVCFQEWIIAEFVRTSRENNNNLHSLLHFFDQRMRPFFLFFPFFQLFVCLFVFFLFIIHFRVNVSYLVWHCYAAFRAAIPNKKECLFSFRTNQYQKAS